MSFPTLKGIATKLVNVFKKNATKAVEDPDDGTQSERDAHNAGGDTTQKASDAAVDNAKDHVVKDLRDLGFKAAPKLGWLKFVGAVTALFAGVLGYMSTQTPVVSPEQQAARDVIRHAKETRRQVEYLNLVVLSEEDFNIMIGGLEVPSAPAPVEAPMSPAAVAAMPPAIAAVAAEPIKVEVTTSGGTREFTTTVGNVYIQSPAPVRHIMEQPAQPKIDHDYDRPNPNDCYVRHCLGGDINKAGGFHKDFTVNAVDGNGNNFGSAHIHN